MFEFARWLGTTAPSEAIKTTAGVAQLLQLLHLLSAGIVLGAVLITVLRIHGRAYAEVQGSDFWGGMARWFWGALGVQAVTGAAFILGEPLRESSALSFWIKLALLLAGVTGMARLGRRVRTLPAGPAPAALRLGSALLLLMWMTIGLLGRFIGYDIAIWGTLSPRGNL